MAAHARVVNVRHSGGVPDGALYVGRANPSHGLTRSRFANPFRVGEDGDLRAVIEQYADRLAGRPALLDAVRHELAGRTLACWCAPAPCHASVLAWVADGHAPAEAAALTLEGQAEQTSLL